ncbi:MAG TPA: DHA2 family efflux MFS transporter permease subunit [Candidatus Baltobacteraceae bacterium]|nr:DHA2 family efflux MFS transporter permease subunit [Candidatus Baltobacteraceae bacterium]
MADTPEIPQSAADSAAPADIAPAPPPVVWRPQFNPWLIAVVVAMAAFMEVLDTSIANVALPYMAGSLGASNDQSTWVLTSYLVSNAIVLPISGWFANALGRKRFFMTCLVIFTISSLLCGIAPSLGAIILFRILQGAGGGGLQPMAQAILADVFPPEKRGLAFALYGVTAIIAPTIGPTLGGWITDNYSWRWIFFINLPVGILTLLLVYRIVEDPPWAKRAAGTRLHFDYVGLSFLALGVGCLQVMLDKGQEDDWFGSHFITSLAILMAVGLVSFVIWEWFYKRPIVDVHMFENLNFLSANGMMFALGILLFSSLVMMPLFLQSLMGYTAESAGLVLSGGGLLLLVLMPIVGVLSGKVQARYLIAFGWLTLAIGMYISSQRLDLDISFSSASMLRLVQVFGLGFLFVPINLASYIGMPAEKSNSVAGLVNFMRNIGSSVGTSMVTTLIERRAQVHQVYLVAHVTPGGPNFLREAAALTARLIAAGGNSILAARQAYGLVFQSVINQATLLAYLDTFLVLAALSAIMFLISFGLKRNQPGGGRVMME